MDPSPAHGRGGAGPLTEPLECAPAHRRVPVGFGREQQWGADPPHSCPHAGCSVASTRPLRAQPLSPCLVPPHASCPLTPAAPQRPPSRPLRSSGARLTQRTFVVMLLVLLGRRVPARALVLVAVSSKWDHLGGPRGEVSPDPAPALSSLDHHHHPYVPASPPHPSTDRQTHRAVP